MKSIELIESAISCHPVAANWPIFLLLYTKPVNITVLKKVTEVGYIYETRLFS